MIDYMFKTDQNWGMSQTNWFQYSIDIFWKCVRFFGGGYNSDSGPQMFCSSSSDSDHIHHCFSDTVISGGGQH